MPNANIASTRSKAFAAYQVSFEAPRPSIEEVAIAALEEPEEELTPLENLERSLHSRWKKRVDQLRRVVRRDRNREKGRYAMKRKLTHQLVVPGRLLLFTAVLTGLTADLVSADRDDPPGPAGCSSLPSQAALQSALESSVGVTGNGGLGFNMWASLVANDGTVCAVAFTGTQFTDQWLGSRVISAQKANTANDFSLGEGSHIPAGTLFPNGLALSTANLYSAVQPGGSLYGLQASNPVDADVAYHGSSNNYGQRNDPLVGRKAGGVNVFGGGLVLLSTGGVKVGGLGVSGDTSCTDHMVAWRVRHALNLDHFGPAGSPVGGVATGPTGAPSFPDNIIFDIAPTANGGLLNPTGTLSQSASGFGHPTCLNPPTLATLPVVQHP